jgi:hypothetical protein
MLLKLRRHVVGRADLEHRRRLLLLGALPPLGRRRHCRHLLPRRSSSSSERDVALRRVAQEHLSAGSDRRDPWSQHAHARGVVEPQLLLLLLLLLMVMMLARSRRRRAPIFVGAGPRPPRAGELLLLLLPVSSCQEEAMRFDGHDGYAPRSWVARLGGNALALRFREGRRRCVRVLSYVGVRTIPKRRRRASTAIYILLSCVDERMPSQAWRARRPRRGGGCLVEMATRVALPGTSQQPLASGKRLAEVATKEGGRAWSLGRKIGSGARIYGALVAAGNNDKKGK